MKKNRRAGGSSGSRARFGVSGSTVSVVIPALNEAENLPYVLDRMPECVTEVILVDGRSDDDTISVVRSMRPDARILVQSTPGKGVAIACGAAAAAGEIIVTLDADGSADPGEIPTFVAALMDGADFVKGSRCLPGAGSADLTRLRGAGNRLLCMSTNVLYRTRYTDLCYGYNAFWRRCLDRLHLDGPGFEIEAQMAVRAAKVGLRVTEVPSWEHSRLHGLSNLRALPDGTRVLRTIVRERFRPKSIAPHRHPRPHFDELPPIASVVEVSPLA
jgi:glycosyltransferase involved in cell wall biosynthesis